MICIGIKTDQEVKENVTCGSLTNNKKKKKKNKKKLKRGDAKKFYFFYFYFFFFSHFSLRFMEIEPSKFVGARRKVLYSIRATRGNQKHGISPSF